MSRETCEMHSFRLNNGFSLPQNKHSSVGRWNFSEVSSWQKHDSWIKGLVSAALGSQTWNLALLTELIRQIGHREEIQTAVFESF